MTWHWYIGRDNELLLDWDSDRGMWYGLERLSRNMRTRRLKVQSFAWARSLQQAHYHGIVTLRKNMPAVERFMWELHLGSDITRAQYNVMRTSRGLAGADLLIASRRYRDFRKPDATCECREKHKHLRITNHCPVLQSLHGPEAGAEYFAINRDRKERTETIDWEPGAVPLTKLLNF